MDTVGCSVRVFKRDRKGNLLDAEDNIVSPNDPEKFKKAVHLNDIHAERGMHCVDCHFRQDSHGDGNLYNEPRAAIEIVMRRLSWNHPRESALCSLPGRLPRQPRAQPPNVERSQNQPLTGQDLTRIRVRDETGARIPLFQRNTRDRKRKDEKGNDIDLKAGDIIQNSMVVPGRWWRVVANCGYRDAGSRDYSEKSRYAKTIRKDNATWGDVPANDSQLAHRDNDMTCVACHSSWVTSCFGCHLSMQANRKMPNRHNEGGNTRNFTQYNFQVLRDDIFMLGRDGTVTGNRVAPVRSSSAVLVSSQNQNREWIYSQQQTTSAEGFAGQTFNTHVPHTVRAKETKQCSDCHVSEQERQQCLVGPVALAGNELRQFHGALCLRCRGSFVGSGSGCD